MSFSNLVSPLVPQALWNAPLSLRDMEGVGLHYLFTR